MNVANTIKQGLLGYPSLFQTPGDVLHQLFVVNGNGYEWAGGQLVYWTDGRKDATEWIEAQIAEARERGHSEGLELYYEEMQHRFEFTKLNIDRIVEHGEHRYRKSIYPICQYAKIMCVPDNVQDDWLAAAYQFCEDCMVTIRGGSARSIDDERHLVLFGELRDKFDAMLIARGLHSTHEERAALIEEMVATIKKGDK